MNKVVEAMIRHDEPSNIGDPDVEAISSIIRTVKERFVDERVNGMLDPVTGHRHPPVSREEAEQRWQKALPQVQRIMLSIPQDDIVQQRLRPNKRTPLPKSSDYSEGPDAPAHFGQDPDDAAFPPMNPAEYEPGWEMGSDKGSGPSKRAMRDEPSLRRGESKTSRILSRLLA